MSSSNTAPRPDHRLFFALYPDMATALRIASLASLLRLKHGLKGKPHDLGRYHITLHHLGDFVGMPEALRAAAEAAAGLVQQAPFALSFDQLLSFNRKASNRPFVLTGGAGLDGVRQFREALGSALKIVDGIKIDKSFTPHLTLLYDDALVPPQALGEPLAWTAREFVLVDSLLGQGKHVPLARWPLRTQSQT